MDSLLLGICDIPDSPLSLLCTAPLGSGSRQVHAYLMVSTDTMEAATCWDRSPASCAAFSDTTLGRNFGSSLQPGKGGGLGAHLVSAGIGGAECIFLRCVTGVEWLTPKNFMVSSAATFLILWVERRLARIFMCIYLMVFLGCWLLKSKIHEAKRKFR